MNVAALLADYGYPIVFFGAIVEGETVMIAAGYLAHRHHLGFWTVVACAATGGTLADQTFFFLGRLFGDKLVDRLPSRIRERAGHAREAVRDHPIRTLLAMRFLYGMRVALPILCGMSGMKISRFVGYNALTALAWAGLFTGIGFAFGAAANTAIKDFERFEGWILLALLPLLWIIHRCSAWLRRRVVS